MSTRVYEKPTIVRHRTGLANKFGTRPARRILSHVDDVPVEELMAQYGSPLFIMSERGIRRTFRAAKRAFEGRYPKVTFGWSYKTNYLDAVCSIFHQMGAWAEVVSEHEYEMATRLGVPESQILYNGPYKPEPALRTAISGGAHVHVDHMDELTAIEKVAKELGVVAEIAIRINMDAGIHPTWDRFGFNLESGQALHAARRIASSRHMKLTGLHTHIGTYVMEPKAYRTAAEKLVAFADELEVSLDTRIERFDFGGGFASKNTLHTQYSSASDTTPDIDEYAEAITGPLVELAGRRDTPPELFLETGRALVDEAGYLAASVVGNKRLSNGMRGVVVDAGVNVLFTSFWYRHEVFPTRDNGSILEDSILYGPLCMNIDVLRPSVKLPHMSPGDKMVFKHAGAYNMTQWLQFIRMRPSVVLIDEAGTPHLIRESEDISDLKRREHLPDHLTMAR